MSLTELPIYLLSQFEEFGRLFIQPVLFFFEQSYPTTIYNIVIGIMALIGFSTTFFMGRYLSDTLFTKKQLPHVSIIVRTLLAIVFTFLLVFLLSVLGIFFTEVLTDQSLLFIAFISIAFPPAGFFFGLFAFATVGLVAPIYWLGMVLSKFVPRHSDWIKKASVVVFTVTALAALFAVTTDASWDDGGSQAHHLHAMVKNTCLIDPQRLNCPQKLEDFAVIEPEFYQKIQDTHQVFYTYNSEKNEYVLVVRYSPRDAILFSQLLKSPQQNGNQANDFQLLEIDTVGKDRVKNMPEFAKEFEYLPDWNKR